MTGSRVVTTSHAVSGCHGRASTPSPALPRPCPGPAPALPRPCPGPAPALPRPCPGPAPAVLICAPVSR
ncbi:hypothetical protein [Micromonospora polyrhachis]|uniref:Uncharacterized protein n=1 Tax=Micromonospora polyrhachis TaxID=1282883 RepID=A0A7W7WNZ0_9ACTN|nr:hypothetical protein [Micromonospora polyrhachis]MBB4957693.1 hypothetical protein [Micromonospora polyrhachis]